MDKFLISRKIAFFYLSLPISLSAINMGLIHNIYSKNFIFKMRHFHMRFLILTATLKQDAIYSDSEKWEEG